MSFYQACVAIDYFAQRKSSRRRPAQYEILTDVKNKIAQLSGKTLPVSVPEPDSPPKKEKVKAKKSRTSNVRDYVNVEFTSKILSFTFNNHKIHYAFRDEKPYFLAKDLLNVFYGSSFTMGAPSVFVPVLNKLGENSTMYCSSLLSKKKALILEKSQVLAVLDKFVSKFSSTSDYEKFKQMIISKKISQDKPVVEKPKVVEESSDSEDNEHDSEEVDSDASASGSSSGLDDSDEEEPVVKKMKVDEVAPPVAVVAAKKSPPIQIMSSSSSDDENADDSDNESSDSDDDQEEEEDENITID